MSGHVDGSSGSEVVITAAGALTPLGANLAQTCASVRSGFAAFSEHAYIQCSPKNPETEADLPLFVAAVPSIEPDIGQMERLIQLLLPAITEMLETSGLTRKQFANTALLIALPQPDTVIKGYQLEGRLALELGRRSGLGVSKFIKTNNIGQSGIFALLKDASDALLNGSVNQCIVVGVDSYLIPERIELLDKLWRIKSDRNVDGFIPGEAAVALLVETSRSAEERGVQPLAVIQSLGFDVELSSFASGKFSGGTGLTKAISDAVGVSSDINIWTWVLAGLNGESYFFHEWGLARGRLDQIFSNLENLSHPADCYGDVGSATGGLLIACVIEAFRNGYNLDDRALLWTSSEHGQCAALALLAPSI